MHCLPDFYRWSGGNGALWLLLPTLGAGCCLGSCMYAAPPPPPSCIQPGHQAAPWGSGHAHRAGRHPRRPFLGASGGSGRRGVSLLSRWGPPWAGSRAELRRALSGAGAGGGRGGWGRAEGVPLRLQPEPPACLPAPRKCASVCCACGEPIIPSRGRDSYRIECLGRHFHEDCYRCEVSVCGGAGLPKFLAMPFPPTWSGLPPPAECVLWPLRSRCCPRGAQAFLQMEAVAALSTWEASLWTSPTAGVSLFSPHGAAPPPAPPGPPSCPPSSDTGQPPD